MIRLVRSGATIRRSRWVAGLSVVGLCAGTIAGAAPAQSQPPAAQPPTTVPPQRGTLPGAPGTLPGTPATPPTPLPTIPVAPPVGGPLPAPIMIAPPTTKPVYLPFPNLPALSLDENNDGIGIAQALTRSRGLQARILWIDATANIERYNTAPKIAALTAQIKLSGFNTIVFDVKPIIGFTVYPSKYAPKLEEWVRPWGTRTLPADFDPLREMVTQAHAQGLSLIVNFNVFSEGHRDFQKGPGYDHPSWQTTLYELQTRVRREVLGTTTYPVTDRANVAPRTPDDLSLFTDASKIPSAPDALIALIDANDTVLLQTTPPAFKALGLTIPRGGAALVGLSAASTGYLRNNASPGAKLAMDSTPIYVPISQRPDRQVPLMTNPNDPAVRQRLLDMLTEVATNYPIDGVIFDDRLRYASLNADFSELTRRQFALYLATGAPGQVPIKPLRWPDDVFHYSIDFPTLERTVVPGPYFDSWLVFRALTIRNWLADAVRTIKSVRPTLTVSTYVGSWYPDYPDLGANWGADDLDAGFHFLNDSYKRTGWAGLTDFIVTGCYYSTASLFEAQTQGISPGQTVEAAGQFSNRAVSDETFVYAGISLDQFKGRPDALRRVLQAACATTQGIMCFDLSHDIDPLWPIFTEAFTPRPAQAPHQIPDLAAQLRAQRAGQRASGIAQPPVILYRGASGTGF